jgi:hypothetical protein
MVQDEPIPLHNPRGVRDPRKDVSVASPQLLLATHSWAAVSPLVGLSLPTCETGVLGDLTFLLLTQLGVNRIMEVTLLYTAGCMPPVFVGAGDEMQG